MHDVHPEWLLYEYDCCNQHVKIPGVELVYHWTNVPHAMLVECGYIHNAIRERINRVAQVLTEHM